VEPKGFRSLDLVGNFGASNAEKRMNPKEKARNRGSQLLAVGKLLSSLSSENFWCRERSSAKAVVNENARQNVDTLRRKRSTLSC